MEPMNFYYKGKQWDDTRGRWSPMFAPAWSPSNWMSMDDCRAEAKRHGLRAVFCGGE